MAYRRKAYRSRRLTQTGGREEGVHRRESETRHFGGEANKLLVSLLPHSCQISPVPASSCYLQVTDTVTPYQEVQRDG